jgi:hypothetical protein
MKDEIPLKVWNAISDIGNSSAIAQEIPSKRSNYRRWVAVYAIFGSQPSYLDKAKNSKYGILIFEIYKDIAANSAEDGVDEKDMIDLFCAGANNKEEIYAILKKENINPSSFVSTWRCEFPL